MRYVIGPAKNPVAVLSGMPFIKNKSLYRALMFTIRMVESGTSPQVAYERASVFHSVNKIELIKVYKVYCQNRLPQDAPL